MRCGNSQNMENEKGILLLIISFLPCFFLSPSSSFSNPNFSFSISPRPISLPPFFSFSSSSSCSFRIPSCFFLLGFFSPFKTRRRRVFYPSNFTSLNARLFLCELRDLS
ncbi:hypothetical protein M5689_004425 [Euphorbia peplus]|nr:hypothetical protein M5689_004425 [Euphorbia peplus]